MIRARERTPSSYTLKRLSRSLVYGVLITVAVSFEAIGAAQQATAAQQTMPQFENAAIPAGIAFSHENGATPEKYLPETMGGGVALLDYDADGWVDLFFVNGGSFADPAVAARARHQLYRNNRDGTFTDVSPDSGIRANGYGMGACAADYDRDGWVDLYVTGVAANQLYRNTGRGRFVDVTVEAGVRPDAWSASCAFGDYDNDGWVDLYVTNYVDFTVADHMYCGDHLRDVRTYCHPNVYPSVGDVLYRNNRDGTFQDVSANAGISASAGNGLGVVFSDINGDGRIDIYVANDATPNFLFLNTGDGVFEESALWAGVAVNDAGRPLAGMGTDTGDVDGDGLADVFVTNLDRQMHSLYRNTGDGLFREVTLASGVGEATRPYVGWGTAFLDYDNDTRLDLAVANGELLDNVRYFRNTTTYAQRNLLLRNDGTGRFQDVGPLSGPGFALENVSRGLAVGDIDNDGDLDIVIANNGQPADVLRNRGASGHSALLLRLEGVESNRDGIGARVRLVLDDQVIVREVHAGSSYLSQNDIRVHFGLGTASEAGRVEVFWPSGTVDRLERIRANQILTIREGEGVVGRQRFAGTRP